jgi:hypothetical protein
VTERSRARDEGRPGPAGEPRGRRGWRLLAVVLALLVAAAVLAVARYAPVLDDVRALRDSARQLAADVQALEPADLDRATLTRLHDGLHALEERIVPIRGLVTEDPVVGVLRGAPIAGPQVEAAHALVDAADSLVEAASIGIDLGDRLIGLREAAAADPERPLMPGLVGLMADSTDEVDRVAALVGSASERLASIPADALGPIREAADLVSGPLERYGPLLDAYREVDDVLPGVLGWGGERRYLVLAQNPAEIRPAGGYVGTVGVIGFRDGAMSELRFQDVYELDLLPGLPFIEPPEELAAHLLGDDQSWRLSDAAWSPHFPTGARRALEFYAIQTGDEDLAGVIGITTFALDRLLEVVGPVTVEEYGVTVQPGEVTLTLLGVTRGTPTSTEGRKDILDALARTAMSRLLAVPPEQWTALLEAVMDIERERLAVAWFEDPDAQRLVSGTGLHGAVRDDAGDYVYAVESNMAPTSKYNLVIDRRDSLVVGLSAEGDALTSLRLDWRNDAGLPGEPYASLRRFSNNTDGWYGAYLRVLVPEGSELVAASGRDSQERRGVERVSREAGRAVFGNYLLMPPGDSTMTWFWSTPGVATPTADGWEYQLLVQKQPGARPHRLAVRVDLPAGAEVLDLPEGATVEDGSVRVEALLETDVEFVVHYRLSAPAAS